VITRRAAVVGVGSLSLGLQFDWRIAVADEFAIELPPNELGFADFGGVWETEPGVQVVADAPDLPKGIERVYAQVILKTAAEADAIFKRHGAGRTFISWFNDVVAGKGYWTDRKISGSQADFESFWDQFLAGKNLTLMEFLAYMAVFINEVAGSLRNKSESYGSKGHPGIAYLFDKVKLTSPGTGKTWTKASYNTGTANRTAFDLFNDNYFIDAHRGKTLGQVLAGTNENVWGGSSYPIDRYPSSGDANKTGFILESDFFKFRGRGLIQTTWRSNYAAVAKFVKENPKSSKVVEAYSKAWANAEIDEVLSTSSNGDWDRLFEDNRKVVLVEAIKIHERSSGYANLSTKSNINGKNLGSLAFMGESIGGRGYGQRLKGRVRQICLALGDLTK
jgi:hypothetical protein